MLPVPMRHVLLLAAILATAGLAACSDAPRDGGAAADTVAPATTGALEDPEAKAFLRDFLAVRGAVDLAGWQNYENLYYVTVNYARRLDPARGGALLQRELPAVLADVIDESREALAGVKAVSPETRYGQEFRDLQVESLAFNVEAFGDLHDRFERVAADSSAASAWTEFGAWADETNPQIEKLDKRLDGFYRGLPASLRAAFDRGVAAFSVGS